MNNTISPELAFALDFVQQAAKTALQHFGGLQQAEWKDNATPVTQIDKQIENDFEAQVQKLFPADGLIGEEFGTRSGTSTRLWMIDPIDGTGPFMLGIPLFTTCISLLEDGIPVLGVIHDAIMQRTFYATKGGGAFLNDTPIHASDTASLNQQFVHIDSLKTGNRWLLPLRQKLLEAGCTPLALNATQYGVALSTAGSLAGAVYSAKYAWDAAAGYCIGTEAGCIATDLYGNQQRYDGDIKGFVLACSPVVHEQLLTMIADCKTMQNDNEKETV